MVKPQDILDYLEELIDLEALDKVKQSIKNALTYNNDEICVKYNFPVTEFKGYPYKEAFNDMSKMMVNELLGCINPIKSLNKVNSAALPCIRPNYGVGTLPSLFGCSCRILDNNLPWVDPLRDESKIRELISKGVPDIRSGLGQKVLETQESYRDVLSKYPKCSEAIRIYHADLQGPFDVAHLIWGEGIYYALYDDPELVHELLQLVTDTYKAFMKEIKKGINDEDGDFVYHWGTLYRGNIVLRDDTPVNLSKASYEEFAKPYDEQLFKEFGSGSMHYCGRAEQWIFSMLETDGLLALNFGQPPNMIFSFDFLEKIYDKASEKKIAITDYGMSKEDIALAASSKFVKGITYSTGISGLEEKR